MASNRSFSENTASGGRGVEAGAANGSSIGCSISNASGYIESTAPVSGISVAETSGIVTTT